MNNTKYIPQEEIFQATNNGLDIILSYYPDAEKCVSNSTKKFKMRDEKTASASIKLKDNVWLINDFGDGAKPMNAINLVMYEENLGYKEALNYIADNFCNGKINGQLQKPQAKPIVTKLENKKPEVIFKSEFSDFELKTLGKFVSAETCEKYNLKPVKHYITEKSYKIESTEEYPIYCFDYGDWQKIYQPLNAEKQYRFFYIGERPTDFVFGLEQLKNEVGKLKEINKVKVIQDLQDSGIIDNFSDEQINKKVDEITKPLLSDLIICSGDRDALNVASAGYNVVWLNSETAKLEKEQYQELKRLSKQIFNVPDIDSTGIKQGTSLALNYLDIVTIQLPDWLLLKKDFRGNPCKDVTDFFNHVNHPVELFNKIKTASAPLRFWNKELTKDGSLKRYTFSQTALYSFLKANGYCRSTDKTNKLGYIYLKIDGNIVKRIETEGRDNIKNNVKDFVNDYLEKNYHPVILRDTFYRSRQTDEPAMANLPINNTLDFKAFDSDYQYWFFPNAAWKITAAGIKETKLSDVKKYVWETDIKTKCNRVKKTDKSLFEVDYSEAYKKALTSKNKQEIDSFLDIDKYELKINDKDFMFLQYLINTSKIYWKKEEEGTRLTEYEIKEQRLHLINKLFALGYLAHKHKNPSTPWAVFAMDAKESEIGKSFGGSGKSIYSRSLDFINETFYIGGRNPKKTADNFIFDGVDEHTYNITIDDADQYLDFGFFFPYITGKFTINPKNNKPFTLEYSESPKFCITSNFTLNKIDPSTERRILYTSFSDYYHKKDNDGYYQDTRSPKEEFGKNIFEDFNQDEWNQFYNLVANCISMYLKFVNDKIEPPLENIEKRNLRTQIGESFLAWATDYFSEPTHLNTTICKDEIFDLALPNLTSNTRKHMDKRKFKDKIRLFCKYKGFEFNPKEQVNDKNDRIMLKYNGINKEHFYISDSSTENLNSIAEGDETPF